MKNSAQEYLIIIKIEPIISEIVTLKMLCKTLHGWNSPLWSLPHLTICRFVQPLLNEKKIINSFSRFTKNISPFEMHFHGFNHFVGHKYTIYSKLQNEKPFSEMVKYIRNFLSPVLRPTKGYPPYYTNKGHLTIAKGILKEEFTKAWPHWKNKEYSTACNADCILLLRRELHQIYQKYEVIDSYNLLGQESLDWQLKLF